MYLVVFENYRRNVLVTLLFIQLLKCLIFSLPLKKLLKQNHKKWWERTTITSVENATMGYLSK